MKFSLKVEVNLKPGHSDPEGETTASMLKELGYKVKTVNVGKVYRLTLDAPSLDEAKRKTDEMCRRLLANPTKDDYVIKFEEEK